MTNPSKDYYSILELSKNATTNEIKKSYRDLAKVWHPDKNPHRREEAEMRFKQLAEAYGVLSNEEKREQYDKYGVCEGEAPSFENGFPDLSELFGSAFPFSGGFGFPGFQENKRREPMRQEISVPISFKEIFQGSEKKVEIEINAYCKDCCGTGSRDKERKKCDKCKGKGSCVLLRQIGPGMMTQQMLPCDECNRSGYVSKLDNKCHTCNGKGTNRDKLVKNISINKNFDYMTNMCIRNAGNYDQNAELSADIYIKFEIKPEKSYSNYEVSNYDLIYRHKIYLHDSITGYKMYHNHVDGNKYLFNIEKVIKDRDYKLVKNLGLPVIENGVEGRGNLIIKFEYNYPENILDHESYKNFVKARDKKSKEINVNEYILIKVVDIEKNKQKSSSDEESNINQGHPGQGSVQGCPVQ